MPSPFAQFLARVGHRVLETPSGEWYDAGPRFFLNLPFHRPIEPTPAELAHVARRGRGLGARFVAPLGGSGRLSYQIVCDLRPYEVDRLSPNTRSKVRRGLRRCTVEKVMPEVVARLGWQAHEDTLRRQRRWSDGDAGARERWDRYWASLLPELGLEVWGAFAEGEVAAFLVTARLEDHVEFLLARSQDRFLDRYPNNALVLTAAADTLAKADVTAITFGLESLEAVDELDRFKFAMGFRRRPIRQRVVFHPAIQPLVTFEPTRRVLARWATARGRSSSRWRKAAGLLDLAGESRPRG